MLGEKLLIKLWDSIADKGIGGLLTPWQTIRTEKARTEARARDLIVLAEAERQAEEIRSGKVKLINVQGELKVIESQNGSSPILAAPTTHNLTTNDVLEHVTAQNNSDSLRREVNMTKAVLHAEDKLSKDPAQPGEDEIDEDWIYRWKDYASNIHIEDLQQLWGAVLAGETKEPGAYSLRTLDFLRNLSKTEAKLIEKCGGFIISGMIARGEKELLESQGLDLSAIMKLQELGIVQGAESLGMSIEFTTMEKGKYQRILVSHDLALVVTHEDEKRKLTLPAYGVTELGKQIATLGIFESNLSYLSSIGRKLIEQGYEVQIADWQYTQGKNGIATNLSDIEEITV